GSFGGLGLALFLGALERSLALGLLTRFLRSLCFTLLAQLLLSLACLLADGVEPGLREVGKGGSRIAFDEILKPYRVAGLLDPIPAALLLGGRRRRHWSRGCDRGQFFAFLLFKQLNLLASQLRIEPVRVLEQEDLPGLCGPHLFDKLVMVLLGFLEVDGFGL